MPRDFADPPHVRPLRNGDAEAVCALITALAAGDPSHEPLRVEEWHRFVAQSWNLRGRDFRVAESGAELVALVTSTRYPCNGREIRNFRIVVRPDTRRRGLGSRLFAEVESQDADAVTQQAYMPSAWRDGERFLATRGFEPVRRSLWMSCDAVPAAVPTPPGVVLRTDHGDSADDDAWSGLSDVGYRGTPFHVALRTEDMRNMRREQGFGLVFAETEGVVVGFCHTKAYGGKACVNSLVVHPDHRSRRLGRALLVSGVRSALNALGPPVRLDVHSGNEHALALYRSVGFRTNETMTTWWREQA